MRQLLVEIRYREPSYEERHGRRESPYRWRYRVDAANEAHATQLALDEFRRIEAISSVGWARDVVEIRVTPP
jgi:1,2-phenylacetyl-CoA epoxidase PaaB subunit